MAETLDTSGFVELTFEALQTPQGISELNRMLRTLFQNIPSDTENVKVTRGYGTPENNVTAQVGSLFLRQDGGANTTLYVKESGDNTDTGWAAI